MKVTAAIPTIGRVEILPAVLYALACQTRPPDELILLDESDSPVTEPYAVHQMLDLLSLQGVEVRIIRNRRRKGIGAARLRCAAEASGDWLLMVDDDVCLRPNALELLMEGLNKISRAGWAVPCCILVNKGLNLDGYIDHRVSRHDPAVTRWTEKYPWFVPYYDYEEDFYQDIPCAGTQAILLRDPAGFQQKSRDMWKLNTLPREDTYMTVKTGPGICVSRARCDHFEHLGQQNRMLWGSSMFYSLHQAAVDNPDLFVRLLGGGVVMPAGDVDNGSSFR